MLVSKMRQTFNFQVATGHLRFRLPPNPLVAVGPADSSANFIRLKRGPHLLLDLIINSSRATNGQKIVNASTSVAKSLLVSVRVASNKSNHFFHIYFGAPVHLGA